MKSLPILLVFLIGCIATQANASNENFGLENAMHSLEDKNFYNQLGLAPKDISEIYTHPKFLNLLNNINNYSFKKANPFPNIKTSQERILDPIGDFTPNLPHASKVEISKFESSLLTAYLDNPKDKVLAQILAIYNLNQAHRDKEKTWRAMEHSILALYFLNRSKDLGVQGNWVKSNIKKTEAYLGKILDDKGQANASEDMEATQYFLNAFTENEQNRYISHTKLLKAIVQNPGNAFANFYFVAVNVWNAGEEAYDEPAMLNNMVLASYFGVRSVQLTEKIERLWEADPVKNVRFRVGNITGGFSVFTRRWLAKLHGDTAQLPLLDDEHRKWYKHHKNFHAFTLSAAFFNEEENFLEGFAAWQDATFNCDFSERTCINTPLFTYNRISFVLSLVDHLLKVGDTGLASALLNFKYDPDAHYDEWTLGRASWDHRANNMDAIVKAYQNDDPKDDPTLFVMAKKKWGSDNIICQSCHQVQGHVWSEEEKKDLHIIKDSILTIGVYPEITTKWYGALKDYVTQ